MATDRMFVRKSGQGTPVVLVHGFPGNAQDWTRVAAALATSHRVIQPDLLGFGQSAKPNNFEGVWVEAQSAALAQELDARGVERYALVGHEYPLRLIFANALRNLERFGVVENALPRLTMPVMVAWGEHDPFFSTTHAQRIADRVPDGRLKVYSGVSHFLHSEAAADYAADIRALIAGD